MFPCFRFPVLPVLCILLLAGCAGRSGFSADGIGSPHTEKRYVVLSGMKDVGEGDLNFQEYAGQVARVMASRGYTLTDAQNADAAVLLSYGAGGPKRVIIESIDYADGFVARPWGYPMMMPGQTIRVDPRSIWTITLSAVELRHEGGKAVIGNGLWKLSLAARSRDGGLRAVFPQLLEAGRGYIGTDTGGIVHVESETPPADTQSVTR